MAKRAPPLPKTYSEINVNTAHEKVGEEVYTTNHLVSCKFFHLEKYLTSVVYFSELSLTQMIQL